MSVWRTNNHDLRVRHFFFLHFIYHCENTLIPAQERPTSEESDRQDYYTEAKKTVRHQMDRLVGCRIVGDEIEQVAVARLQQQPGAEHQNHEAGELLKFCKKSLDWFCFDVDNIALQEDGLQIHGIQCSLRGKMCYYTHINRLKMKTAILKYFMSIGRQCHPTLIDLRTQTESLLTRRVLKATPSHQWSRDNFVAAEKVIT